MEKTFAWPSIALLGILCSSCEGVDVRALPEYACLTRAEILDGWLTVTPEGHLEDSAKAKSFPLKKAEVEPVTENATTKQAPPDTKFRFLSSGQFVIELGQVEEFPVPFVVTCTGDFNKKIFTSVQVNGKIYRPKAGEVWSTKDL